jgi:Abortive infection alpha
MSMVDDHDDGPQGFDALAGAARIALSVWWHTTEWAVRTSLGVPRRAVRLALDPERVLDRARDLHGAVAGRAPGPREDRADAPDAAQNGTSNGYHAAVAATLREEGEELLRRSRDVRYEEVSHPAYERMLAELAPDEGRILRLLVHEGPQPAVDVRTGGPVGIVRSRLIAPGLSMIGARAGCRYVERVPSYLNNLFRLGLVWFSRETLRDPRRYQVLEAQPDVLEAIGSVRYAKIVRRSIHLTPFGEDSCRVALCSAQTSLDSLPAHSTPPETTSGSETLRI